MIISQNEFGVLRYFAIKRREKSSQARLHEDNTQATTTVSTVFIKKIVIIMNSNKYDNRINKNMQFQQKE